MTAVHKMISDSKGHCWRTWLFSECYEQTHSWKVEWKGKIDLLIFCTVFYQVKGQLSVYQEHFLLPWADQLYGNADLIFQPYVAPAPLPEVPIADGVPVPNWSANQSDLNPREEWETGSNNTEELKATIRATWVSWTPQQSQQMDHLYVVLCHCSNSCKISILIQQFCAKILFEKFLCLK